MKKELFSMAVNLGLLLMSGAVGLALCEVSLRLFYPKYRYVAEAQFSSDAMRIWTRTPNSRDWMNHPDTLVAHSFYHNNLALRQHRDFRKADLAVATNIGVFGDSFTENIGMPVQYSFTEPLDYLLNLGGERFNVLNFGVSGYGTDRLLLHYEHFRYAEDLDHIFYIYCHNDLENIRQTGLFHLDDAGHLVWNEAIRESWWTSLIRRLHIPYLILDVRHRGSFLMAETTGNTAYLKRGIGERVRDERYGARLRRAWSRRRPAPTARKDALEIFRQLIRRWKHLAESNGSTFSVVLLPDSPPQPVVVDLLKAEDVESIALDDCFGNYDSAHPDRAWINSPYRFRNDYHWNEAGNQLAALCLYRFLEENVGLPSRSEDWLWEAISRYYAAFRGGMPLETGGGGAKGAVSLEAAAAIREKYLALDMSNALKGVQNEFIQLVAQSDKRIIASNFDVYLHRNDLFYVKADCRPVDMEARFFLHMIPVDEKDLGEPRRSLGFIRRSFNFAMRGFRIGRHGCATKTPLPYPVRYIRTGQYVPDKGRLWEGEGWIDPHSVGEERPKFSVAAGTRIIQSDFDVYLEGRELVYHKADCGPADRAASFFLHVTPVDETDLPRRRVEHGFDNQDFRNPSKFRVNEFGCTRTVQLPTYAIRRIRTGQYIPGKDPLWEGEFATEQNALEQN